MDGARRLSSDRVTRAIGAALEAVTDSPHAGRLVGAALELEGLPSIPTDRESARRFVTGPLRHLVVSELGLGAYGVVAERLGPVFLEPVHRAAMQTPRPAIPPPASPVGARSGTYRIVPERGAARRVVAISVDSRALGELELELGPGGTLARACLLSDLTRLVRQGPALLWVDAVLPSIPLGAVAAATEGPLRHAEVVVTGLSERELVRVARVYPAVRRWRRGHLADVAALLRAENAS